MIDSIATQARPSLLNWLYRLFVVTGISLSCSAQAFELAAGFSIVEQGDDRNRPAANLHIGINDFYLGRAYYYGREFGPVREDTYVLAGGRRFGLFKSNYITGHVGACVMNEQITLKFRSEDTTSAGSGRNRTEDNYNVGGVFGIAAALPKSASPLYAGISWDSHILAAGINGGLLLSSGRKQTVSVYLGAAL